MTVTEPLPQGDLIDSAAVAAWLGIHRRTIRKWIRAGRFLKPLALGEGKGMPRWRRSDLIDWLRQVPTRA